MHWVIAVKRNNILARLCDTSGNELKFNSVEEAAEFINIFNIPVDQNMLLTHIVNQGDRTWIIEELKYC